MEQEIATNRVLKEMIQLGIIPLSRIREVSRYLDMVYAIGWEHRTGKGEIPIVQLDKTRKIINFFWSLSEASRYLQITLGQIHRCVHDQKATCHGYYFRKATGKEIIKESESLRGVVDKTPVKPCHRASE